MKKILLLACLLLAVASPVTARAETGETDNTFGSYGRVATEVRLGVPWKRARVQMAIGPNGRIVVGTAGTLVAYREDGQLDESFGNDGFLSVAVPRITRFQLADLSIDPEGRVVAIGTATMGQRSAAAVLRYLPSGAPDPTFGDGDGVVLGGFGLHARWIVASFGTTDREGRIVFVVGDRDRDRLCGRYRVQRRDRLVVRLTPDGRRDLSFGTLGVQNLLPLERIGAMAAGPSGGFVFAGTSRRDCRKRPLNGVIRLREDGSRVGRFGVRRTARFSEAISSVAVDSHGRIVVLFKAMPHGDGEEETVVRRLLPNGSKDRSFYGGGIGFWERGHYRWSTVAIRAGDRPILVGTLSLSNHPQRNFLAVPMRKSGALEWQASWRGWAWTERLGPMSRATASEASIDAKGRLLIAGSVDRSRLAPRGGFALIRFELS